MIAKHAMATLLAGALLSPVAATAGAGAGMDDSRDTHGLIVAVSEFADPALQPFALQGAGADAERMAAAYEMMAGSSDSLTRLTGGDATLPEVEGHLAAIAAEASAGDRIFLYFSAHGTRVPDGPDRDEADGLDEVLLLADAGEWADGSLPGALSDDALALRVREMRERGADVFLVIDSCASGGAARNSGPFAARALPPALLSVPQTVSRAAVRSDLTWIDDDMPPGSGRLVLLAASPTDQAAWDTPDGGMFTRALGEAMAKAPQDFVTLTRNQRRIHSGFGLPGPSSVAEGAVEASFFFSGAEIDSFASALSLPAPDWSVALHAAGQPSCDPDRIGAPRELDAGERQRLAHCDAVMLSVEGDTPSRVDAWYVDSADQRTLLSPIGGLATGGGSPALLSFTFISRDPKTGLPLPSGIDRLVLMRRPLGSDAPDAAMTIEFAVER